MDHHHNGLDGTLQLDPHKLKTLRKELGLSQQSLAQLCLEKRLCVSIASIKRAEAGKPVLYRTARHLANVYDAELNNLLQPACAAPASTGSALPATPATPPGDSKLLESLCEEIQKFSARVALITSVPR